jgi:hypothetical protein
MPPGCSKVKNPIDVIPMEVVDKGLHRGDAVERSMGSLGVVLTDPGR